MGVEVAIAAVSGLYSIYSGMQQEKDAGKAAAKQEAMARQNAANMEAETMEEKRRAQTAADEAAATARAKAGASGIETEGSSMDIFMGAQEDKAQSEIDWLVKSGKNRADLAKQGGYLDADATRAQGKAALGDALGSGFGQLASAGTDWYKGYGASTKPNKSIWSY